MKRGQPVPDVAALPEQAASPPDEAVSTPVPDVAALPEQAAIERRGFKTTLEADAEKKAAAWLLERGKQSPRLPKAAAFKEARDQWSRLTQRAFNDRVWPQNAPKEWKKAGRPKAERK
jgi:hypothetical protein